MKTTITGRITRNEPEMQNLPDTPAHALETYYARYGARRAAADWDASTEVCPKCEREHVKYRVYDIGPDSRYLYQCNDCGHAWWAESEQ